MNDNELQDVLNRYREEEACFLHFVPRIEWLIDSPFCRSLSGWLHNSGASWERMKATPDLGSMLPEESGLYMFVWKPDLAFRFEGTTDSENLTWVLYVGKAGTEHSSTATIKNRYVGEYSKYVGKDARCLWDNNDPKDRAGLLSRFLTLRPLEFWYLPMKKVSDIVLLEKKLIRTLRPPLNKQHGVTLRSGKPQPVI